jgi:hypothetical protein
MRKILLVASAVLALSNSIVVSFAQCPIPRPTAAAMEVDAETTRKIIQMTMGSEYFQQHLETIKNYDTYYSVLHIGNRYVLANGWRCLAIHDKQCCDECGCRKIP